MVRPLRKPLPRGSVHILHPPQLYPHSSWIRKSKRHSMVGEAAEGEERHSMCGQAEGAARGLAGLAGEEGQGPTRSCPAQLSSSSLLTGCSGGFVQRDPAHRSWNRGSRNPTASTRLNPTWGERGTVSLEGRLDPYAQCPLGSCPPLPEHCPPNYSSGGSTAGAGGSGGGGVCGSREGRCSGGIRRPGVEASCALTVIWGNNFASLSLPSHL